MPADGKLPPDESKLAAVLFAVPAVKGVSFGEGLPDEKAAVLRWCSASAVVSGYPFTATEEETAERLSQPVKGRDK